MTRRLEAVLWDMDGTLIDSEPAWFDAQADIVKRYGGTWSHADGAALVGADMASTVSAMQAAGAHLASDDMSKLLSEAVTSTLRHAVTWQPGAVELLMELRRVGIAQAIVTTSSHTMTQVVLDALPTGTIQLIVTSDDVQNGKPDPEPYLLAAAQLNCDIRNCVVVEDSLIGLEAGIASGAHVVGVSHDADLPEPLGWTQWRSLRDRSVLDIQGLLLI